MERAVARRHELAETIVRFARSVCSKAEPMERAVARRHELAETIMRFERIGPNGFLMHRLRAKTFVGAAPLSET